MKLGTDWRQRALALAVAAGCGLVCGSAFAAVPTRFATLLQATHLRRGDRVTAAMPVTADFHVTVALKLRNAAGLHAFNARPHAAMSRATLAQDYLPTAAQAEAVVQYLEQSGFRNVKVSADRMLVSGVGNGAAVKQAFQTTMVEVHTVNGRTAWANSSPIKVPTALKDSIVAVTGLQTVHRMHTLARRMTTTAPSVAGHVATQFAAIYDASSLPAATGVNVAVWGWGGMTQTIADLDTFTTDLKLPTVNASVVCTNVGETFDNNGNVTNPGKTTIGDASCGGASDQGSTEWDMDTQDIVGMTGGVKSLTIYAAASPADGDLLNALEEIVTPTVGESRAQVINASFGGCERGSDANQGGDGSMQAMDQLFAEADAQGQTFSVSSGDSGFDECGDGQMDSASYPASSPYVVEVSGTTLRATSTAWARENVWIDAGGSPSSAEPAQAWQAPLTYGQYAGQRGPDVAFDANPASGAIFINRGGPVQVGGTSLAAPLFAGAWARILQSHPTLGFAAPHLYALPASAFHDVTAGNNRGSDPTGGYVAKPGWDWATGFGSLDVAKAAAALK